MCNRICDIIFYMSIAASRTDRLISSYLRSEMQLRSITQEQMTKAIERKAQSYISDRLTCKKTWDISELDMLAPLFGLPNALALIAAASGSYKGEVD